MNLITLTRRAFKRTSRKQINQWLAQGFSLRVVRA